MEDSWMIINYDVNYTPNTTSVTGEDFICERTPSLSIQQLTVLSCWNCLFRISYTPLPLSTHQTCFRSWFCSRCPFSITLVWWPAGLGIQTFPVMILFHVNKLAFLVYIQFLGKQPGSLKTRPKLTALRSRHWEKAAMRY